MNKVEKVKGKVVARKTEKVKAEESSANMLIAQAIDKGTSVEVMERLMTIRRELKQEYAKEEFSKAMSEFQAECPTIQKNKAGGQTRAGKVAYFYAPIESIVEQVKKSIKNHGFSYSIQTIMTEKTVKVTCTVKHIAGHCESSEIELPLTARTEIMSAPQVVAATVTYGKRYSFCNAFGIMTGDEDTDGKSSDDEGKKEKAKTPQPRTPEKPQPKQAEPPQPEKSTANRLDEPTPIMKLNWAIKDYCLLAKKSIYDIQKQLREKYKVDLLKELTPAKMASIEQAYIKLYTELKAKKQPAKTPPPEDLSQTNEEGISF